MKEYTIVFSYALWELASEPHLGLKHDFSTRHYKNLTNVSSKMQLSASHWGPSMIRRPLNLCLVTCTVPDRNSHRDAWPRGASAKESPSITVQGLLLSSINFYSY